jgi:hypothetical protein
VSILYALPSSEGNSGNDKEARQDDNKWKMPRGSDRREQAREKPSKREDDQEAK